MSALASTAWSCEIDLRKPCCETRPVNPVRIIAMSFGIAAGCAWMAGAFRATALQPPPDAERHWAFQPVRTVEVPAVKNVAWPKTGVDRFILARLEAARLSPAPPADPRTL